MPISTRTKKTTVAAPAVSHVIDPAQAASVAADTVLLLRPGMTATAAIIDAYRPASGPHISFDVDGSASTDPSSDSNDPDESYLRESRIVALWLAVHGTPTHDYPVHLYDLLLEIFANELAEFVDDLPLCKEGALHHVARTCNIDAGLASALIMEWEPRRGSTTPF